MSENRVQRWREKMKEGGMEPLTIWLPKEEKLRLEDLARTWRRSPSEVIQEAWAHYHPGSAPTVSHVTDTIQLQELIEAKVEEVLDRRLRITETATETVTVTGAATETATETVTDTIPVTSDDFKLGIPNLDDTETDTETATDTVPVTESTKDDIPDILMEPMSTNGTDQVPTKAEMVARLQALRAKGLSGGQIAAQLQAEGVPTLTGKGQWQKGTVNKLLLSRGQDS